jgi:hypothetical protein
MEPSDMIQKLLKNLKSCLEEDEIILLPEEINIAYVGKKLPFSLIDKEDVTIAFKSDDYSGIRNFFSPSLPTLIMKSSI